ncbi:TonB-dependent receptor [Steroidobacter sp. S1-65]|uniref:TonB-dependent receptor n=1 Tax=Steroidobacter gossypii TaxID=2805490 RepID=A0ABS1X5A1_9GAMM|nr:TonB-dependent receptor [Steroidobacter gossypii]MBM0108370.1 TonB-dependent receptor [Steroidobacter gossypii]
MRTKLFTSASAAAMLMSPLVVQGQSSPQPTYELEEIVVTATRRSERLQDVPLSITAFSQEDLTAKGIVGYEGLARETPGVVLNKPSQNFNNFTARGIATNGYNANLQSTVAIYVDELPISSIGNTTVIDPNLFDVERIEFLRGPQGTLFGSGSLSGALRILTKNPDLTGFDATAMIDTGVTDGDALRQRYNAMVNVPLVEDKLAVRMVGFYRDEEGWVDNLGTGVENANQLVDYGGRFITLWQATDELSVRLLVSHEDSKPEDSSLISPELGEYKRFSDQPDLFVGKITNYNATLEYQFSGAKLTSSSTLSEFDQQFYVDISAAVGGLVPYGLDANASQETFVQETRLASDAGGKWDWTLGVFYLDRRNDVDYLQRSNPAFLQARGLVLPDQYFSKQYTHFNTTELAGFGELTYRLTDRLWVTGGLRYGGVEIQGFTEGGYTTPYFAYAFGGLTGPLPITQTAPAVGRKVEKDDPSYKVSLSFAPTSNLTTYATFSTGFRTPIVNGQAGSVSLIDPTDLVIPDGADSDTLKNYEIGAKGRWFNGRLTTNLAAYYIDWTDIQVQANRVSDAIQFATNIGGARSQGFEFEITAAPSNGWLLGLNGSFSDAKVNDLTAQEAAISGAVMDARLTAPKFQGAAFVQYDFPLGASWMGTSSVAFQHVDSYPNQFPNVPGRPATTAPTYGYTDSYNNVNLTLGANMGSLSVTAYAENLLDDDSIIYIHPETFLASRFATMRPRTVGLRLKYDF